ncbi:hypothetical protein DFP72DRAFT_1065097 [Ephemerocybe angulata]|uniref:Uncharacterized protein n=1 Tax=Ephemerocybe angulata TaxID=980116 RepID=A0A8H6I6J6_9AGAR|nr:hypothetical protein DFP72DRAFT_1065097 [Tulosesus angulatus]
MDDDAGWSRVCPCGKRFYQPNSYSNHLNSCTVNKKQLGSSLEGAKLRYDLKKSKQKRGNVAIESWYGGKSLDVDYQIEDGPSKSFAAELLRHEDNTTPPAVADEEAAPPVEDPVEELGRGRRVRQQLHRAKDYDLSSAIPIGLSSMVVAGIPPSPSSSIRSASSRAAGLDPAPTESALSYTPEETMNDPHSKRSTVMDAEAWESTPRNEFGLYRTYWTLEKKPHDATQYLSEDDLLEDPSTDSPATGEDLAPLYPFPNLSAFQLGEWYWGDDSGKSRESFDRLVDILTSPGFSTEDLRAANWNRINDILASSTSDEAVGQWSSDGTAWLSIPITINVPFNTSSLKPGPLPYTIPEFRYRPLVPVLLERLRSATSRNLFHTLPSDLRWQDDVRVYGELYHSPAFIDAYKEIQLLPPEPEEDELPRCVIGLMFASDETAAAAFGTMKIWPLYLLFGNESKQRRIKPSLKLFEEIAYFQSLPDEFADWYTRLSGKKRVASTLSTHLNRELFHGQWNALLDAEFVHAYQHGLVVDCFDKVRRRFYPRILTYSADYPEKMTIVGVRQNGSHPCPRCTISEASLDGLGTVEDRRIRTDGVRTDDDDRRLKIARAREHIYQKNGAINSSVVEKLLKPTSLVPAQNAFSDKLSGFGLDVFTLPAVDPLHEVELGTWRDVFVQLRRLIEAIDPGLKNALDYRFRQVPTFGRDTIRRFRNNMSEMKQLAARDFEDMLQCAMPVFEGLFPEGHDARVQRLLFVLAHWHAMVKMKLHTDTTLDIMDTLTTELGEAAHAFSSETCAAFETLELKREYEARKRTEARKSTKKNKAGPEASVTDVHVAAVEVTPGRASLTKIQNRVGNQDSQRPKDDADGRRLRTWNLSVPKFHALGDAVSYIRRFGTTDSYSTQISERLHRFPKGRYQRTNKKSVPRQLSSIQTRQARIKKLRDQLTPAADEGPPVRWTQWGPGPGGRYFIGKSQNHPMVFGRFVSLNGNDLAVKNFIPKLKEHLFPRIVEQLLHEARMFPEEHSIAIPALEGLSSSPSDSDMKGIHFHSETFYNHKVLQVFYTTYDCLRGTDILNPSTSRRDFMCLRSQDPAGESDNTAGTPKFVFGRLLGIFHVNVVYTGPGMLDYRKRRFDVLWVRWYTPSEPEGFGELPWSSHRLDRIHLAPLSHFDACGFLDPGYVLRGAHIIPRYAGGKMYEDQELADTRLFSKCVRNRNEYKDYYVNRWVICILTSPAYGIFNSYSNRFADRDMVMRFHWGLGVGHAYSHSHRRRKSPNPAPMDVDQIKRRSDDIQSSSEHDVGDTNVDHLTDSDDSTYDIPCDDEDLPSPASGMHSPALSSALQEPESSDNESEIYAD